MVATLSQYIVWGIMKRTTLVLPCVMIAGAFLHGSSYTSAQKPATAKSPMTTGVIAGEVTDRQGAPLAGATVAITNTKTQELTTLKTDANGEYRAERLEPGGYQVVISAAGLIAKTQKVHVKERHTTKVDAHLKPVISAKPASSGSS